MDLGDAAALCVCARGEKERLEGQHECIWLVASGRWCLAMRRSQQERQRQQACARKERERERAVSTLGRRARVEHHSASRGGIACHAGRGEGSASGGSFCACRVLLRCACASGSGVHHSGMHSSSHTKFVFGTLQLRITFYLLKIFLK